MQKARALALLLALGAVAGSESAGAQVAPFTTIPSWSPEEATTDPVEGLGTSLAVGYFNDDAFPDLAAGAPDTPLGGEVRIYYGTAFGLSPAAGLILQLPVADRTAGQGFGTTLATVRSPTGSEDGLVVGAPLYQGTGAVAFYHAPPPGPPGPAANFFHPGGTNSVRFGAALAVGDLGDDETLEIVVGDPDYGGGDGQITFLDPLENVLDTEDGIDNEALGSSLAIVALDTSLDFPSLVVGASNARGGPVEPTERRGKIYLAQHQGPANFFDRAEVAVAYGNVADGGYGSGLLGPITIADPPGGLEDLLILQPGTATDAGMLMGITASSRDYSIGSQFDALTEPDASRKLTGGFARVPDWSGDLCDELLVGFPHTGGGSVYLLSASPGEDCSGQYAFHESFWSYDPGEPTSLGGTSIVVAEGLTGEPGPSVVIGLPGGDTDGNQLVAFGPGLPPYTYTPEPAVGEVHQIWPHRIWDFTLTVTDAGAQPVPDLPVSWGFVSTPLAGITSQEIGATTDPSGVARAEVGVELGSDIGSVTLQASAGGRSFLWLLEVSSAPPVAGLQLQAEPTSGYLQVGGSVELVATVTHSDGADLRGWPVSWTISEDSSRISGATPAKLGFEDTSLLGVQETALNTLQFGSEPGQVIVTASIEIGSEQASADFVLQVGEEISGTLELIAENSELQVLKDQPATLRAQVLDAGTPRSGVSVDWGLSTGDGSCEGTELASESDAEGWVTASYQRFGSVGTCQFLASIAGAGPSGSVEFTVEWVGAGKLPSAYGCEQEQGPAGPLAFLLALGLLLGAAGRRRVAGMLLLLAVALPARAEELERPKLAYLGIKGSDLSKVDEIKGISEYAQGELARLEVYAVLGTAEIQALLGLEQQKQLLGCVDDSSNCLAELGGALGAGRLVSGSITQVGSSVILSLSLLDVESARLVHRAGARVSVTDSFEPILDRIPALMRELAEHDPAVKDRLAPIVAETPAPSGAPGTPAPTGTASTGAVVTGTVATTPVGTAAPSVDPGSHPASPAVPDPGPRPDPGPHQWVLALRTDVDPMGPGAFPGVQLAWSHGSFGAAVALLLRPWEVDAQGAPQRFFGARLEGRWMPLRSGPLTGHLGLGFTTLDTLFHLRTAVGGGFAAGPVRLGLELAYERLLVESSSFRPNVLVLGLSVGLSLGR